MNKKSDIGLIGLAVMGENLALNMERNGFQSYVSGVSTSWAVVSLAERKGH